MTQETNRGMLDKEQYEKNVGMKLQHEFCTTPGVTNMNATFTSVKYNN